MHKPVSKDRFLCGVLKCIPSIKIQCLREIYKEFLQFYQPHTKYGGRYCFHRRVSLILSTWGDLVWGVGCLVRGGGYMSGQRTVSTFDLIPRGSPIFHHLSERGLPFSLAVGTHPTGMHSRLRQQLLPWSISALPILRGILYTPFVPICIGISTRIKIDLSPLHALLKITMNTKCHKKTLFRR